MAVWAEEPKILQPIVGAVTVSVVELKSQPPAPPIDDATIGARLLEQSSANQSNGESAHVLVRAVANQNLLQWNADLGPELAQEMPLASEVTCVDPQAIPMTVEGQVVGSPCNQTELLERLGYVA
jgi:hypothetical protein